MAVQRHSRYDYTIEYTKVCKKFSKDALVGCIAHELAHIVKSVKMNRATWFLHLWRYTIDSNYEDKDEYETDKLTIERGFGKQLLQFTVECDQLGYDVATELKRIKSLVVEWEQGTIL